MRITYESQFLGIMFRARAEEFQDIPRRTGWPHYEAYSIMKA